MDTTNAAHPPPASPSSAESHHPYLGHARSAGAPGKFAPANSWGGNHWLRSDSGDAESPVARFYILLRFSVVMAVLLALAAFVRSSFFPVTEIVVQGVHRLAASELVAQSGVRVGDPRFAVSVADVAARVKRHPRVAAASVAVHPWGRVLITVTERTPKAAVTYHNAFLIMDADGVLIETRHDRNNLPVLQVAGLSLPWVRVGDRFLAPQVDQTLRVLQLLPPSVRTGLIEIRMDSASEFTLVTPDGVPVLLGPFRGLGDRAAMLPEILSTVRERKIAVQYLDLRFIDNVVLKPARAAEGEGDGP